MPLTDLKKVRYENWLHMTRSNRDQWFMLFREYCNGKSEFVRDFASKRGRILCKNITQMYGYMLQYGYELQQDAYISIYEFRDTKQIGNRKPLPDYSRPYAIDKIVFDIDCEQNMESGWELTKEVFDILVEYLSPKEKRLAKYGLFYTGGRGYHIYYLPSPQNIFLSADAARNFCDAIHVATGYSDFVDRSLFGDVSTDIRIPYTLHPQAACQMVPVYLDMTLEEMIKLSLRTNTPSTLFHRAKHWRKWHG